MSLIDKTIGPRKRVSHFPVSDYRPYEEPMWTCRVCSIGLDFDYDKSFQVCKEHKDTQEYMDIVQADNVKLDEKRKEAQRKRFAYLNETEAKDVTVCPHCFHHHDAYHSIGDLCGDGEHWEMPCDACQEPFLVTLDIIYNYRTKKIEACNPKTSENKP